MDTHIVGQKIGLNRQFYLTIPLELEEAAIIDGCSRLGVWYYIFLPLSKSIMIILGVIFFITNYNDFIWPLIITSSDRMRVIQVGLVYFTSARGSHWNLILAGAAVAALPTILIFIFMQKYLVEGIKMSGIKA
jgi:multiple sugar transport system permease protein